MMRLEQEIFDDLATLSISKGYIHAIANVCFRDYVVSFGDELKPENILRLYSRLRLIRTEVTTLIGLMMRAPIDFSLPLPQTISDYIERSETLLEELHHTLAAPFAHYLTSENASNPDFNPARIGEALREPIFYGGESAYAFQYRDLAPLKYGADANWLRQHKGLDLEVGREVCRHVAALLNDRLIETLRGLRSRLVAEWTMLPAFAFSCDELAARSGQPVKSVRAVVEAFAAPESERNTTFASLHDFNSAYAYPLIRRGPDEFLLLQPYGIAEALYETPFYWMGADSGYVQTALRHRGEFTETFAAERLKRVFGAQQVFENVEMFRLKGQPVGEIDVLVLFGDRAIVLQAKSKKLTLPARKGNDLQLQADFKAAVQDGVDQAMACAGLLALCAADGRLHDASIGISTASTGLTVHCSGLPNREVEARLRGHCERRKYLQRANSWFGLALGLDGSVRLVAELVGPWQFDAVRALGRQHWEMRRRCAR